MNILTEICAANQRIFAANIQMVYTMSDLMMAMTMPNLGLEVTHMLTDQSELVDVFGCGPVMIEDQPDILDEEFVEEELEMTLEQLVAKDPFLVFVRPSE